MCVHILCCTCVLTVPTWSKHCIRLVRFQWMVYFIYRRSSPNSNPKRTMVYMPILVNVGKPTNSIWKFQYPNNGRVQNPQHCSSYFHIRFAQLQCDSAPWDLWRVKTLWTAGTRARTHTDTHACMHHAWMHTQIKLVSFPCHHFRYKMSAERMVRYLWADSLILTILNNSGQSDCLMVTCLPKSGAKLACTKLKITSRWPLVMEKSKLSSAEMLEAICRISLQMQRSISKVEYP